MQRIDINLVVIQGRLCRDPELRYTAAQKPVCNFDIANNNRDHTYFIRCTAWDKLAETCNEYLHKGKEVLIEGKLRENKYEKDGDSRKYLYIQIREIKFLSGNTPADKKNDNPKQKVEKLANMKAENIDDDINDKPF
jgi:single-strand DNA-binding protein